jgi:hypothetical protein
LVELKERKKAVPMALGMVSQTVELLASQSVAMMVSTMECERVEKLDT